MKVGIKRLSVLVAAMAVFAAFTAAPASAVGSGTMEVSFTVDASSGDVVACVSDDSNDNFDLVVTATGYQDANGVVLEVSRAYGNPVCAYIEGGFDSAYGAVVYTMEWASTSSGAGGSLARTCAEVSNTPICTPT